MAYTIPTAAELKAIYTDFAAVADAPVTHYIERAARMVDTTWTEGDYATAIMLLACHLMVTQGLGTGNDAKLAGFTMIKSGQLTLQRAADNASDNPWAASKYGSQFYALLKLNKPGGALAMTQTLASEGWHPMLPYPAATY